MARLNQNRSKLLLGCGSAALAIGLAAAPERAQAQAFQATEAFVDGSGSRSLGSGTETITIDTNSAIIEWTPDEDGQGNALDFLPTGNTATFQNGVNVSDFAVLNIVLPSANGNVTVFDGTVISQLIDPVTGGVTPGGTLVFYSPSGILVGGNAVFDVGNLILTTLDPTTTFSDWAGAGQAGSLSLGTGTPTTANIVIGPGAQVLASAENSYFAVVSAEVQMFGTSLINGSQAYVAGQAVNLTVSNGLFDIEIPVGTDSLTPVVFGGDVGGPSSTGLGDNHLIYAVARANNDPISMLFSGNLGFAPAASAGIVNGEIILAANYDVFGRTVDGGAIDQGLNALFDANSAVTDVAGSIFLEDFASSSSILAIANEEVQVTAFNGPSSIDGNLLMVGRSFSELTSSNGQLFDITGDVYVSADAYGRVGFDLITGETDATAGTAFIDAFLGGTLNIGGDVIVSASAVAGSDLDFLNSGVATGGSASVGSTGGFLDIAGVVEVLAIASEAQVGFNYLEGGTFNAGSARVFASDGGFVTLRDDVFVIANAVGTTGDQSDGSTASNAFGGFASIDALGTSFVEIQGNLIAEARANAGSSGDFVQGGLADAGVVSMFVDADGDISVLNSVTLRADAFGGSNAFGQGGNALGGAARAFTPAGGTISIGGDFTASSAAFGGSGTSGGDATGGTAGIEARVGFIDVTGGAVSSSIAQGGDAFFGFGGAGGNAIGGLSFLQATGTLTASATLNIGGAATVESTARGGTGGLGDGSTIAAGRGGDATAGQFGTVNQADPAFNNGAFVLGGGDNGNLSIGLTTNIFNFGVGGNGGNGGLGQAGGDGGTGTGGTAQAGQALLGGDGSVGAGVVSFGDVFITANGEGGNGGFGGSTGDPRGNGGDGNGFGAFFTARAGSITAGNVDVTAGAGGGEGNVGGIGTGGFASVQASFGADVQMASLEVIAAATGGSGDIEGGAAIAGEAELNLNGGLITVTGDATFDANAAGGFGFNGVGGAATGGTAEVAVVEDTSSVSVNGFTLLRSTAQAGSGSSALAGALATGGTSIVNVLSQGSADFNFINLDSSAIGGDNFGTGVGGDGIGGARAFALVDNGGSFNAVDFFATSYGTGGEGVGGGNGFGGVSGIQVLFGTATIQTTATAEASGIGGNASLSGFGGDGGTGTGGKAVIVGQGTQTDIGSVIIGGDANVVANGFGGSGGQGDGSTILAGRGGDGIAGIFSATVASDPTESSGAALIAGADNGNLEVGGNSTVQARGFGGGGGSGGLDQAGGDGGNGTGGSATAGLLVQGTDGTVGIGSAAYGDVFVDTSSFGGVGGNGGSTTDPEGNGGTGLGGRALVSGALGTLVGGNVTTFSDGVGGNGAIGGDGIGGDRSGIFTNGGGTITLDGFSAFALGQGGVGSSGRGGDGTGGQAFMGFQGGITEVTGDVIIDATGRGGSSRAADGGDGTGGVADIAVFSPVFGNGLIGGHARIFANGIGGGAGQDATGGVGTGGEAFIQAQAGGLVSVGSAQVNAVGQGGSGAVFDDEGIITTFAAAGGDGFGGVADIRAFDTGSRVVIERNVPSQFADPISLGTTLSASGFGGNATGGTGIGGTGTGGEAVISATTGASIEFSLDPANDPNSIQFIRIHSRGRGGNSSVEGGAGGQAISGLGLIEVDGGSVSMGATVFSMFAQGGNSLDQNLNITGGAAFGGDRQVSVTNGGTLTAELLGGVSGAVGGNGSGTGNGGDATGGTASTLIDNATYNMVGRNIVVDQSTGGAGAIGGNVTAGTVSFTANAATLNGIANADGESVLVIGGGNSGGFGETLGGSAVGAQVDVQITDSQWIGGALQANASAFGGAANDIVNGTGGAAQSGNLTVNITNSNLQLATQPDTNGFIFDPDTGQQVPTVFPGAINSISSNAIGGSGAVGGDAQAGTVLVSMIGSSVTIAPSASQPGILDITNLSTGGTGEAEGGQAIGGDVTLQMGDSTLTADDLRVQANSTGGNGIGVDGLGGIAFGGTALLEFLGGASTINSDIFVEATGFGGVSRGGDGATGTGGTAGVSATSPDVSVASIGGHTNIIASGFGGGGGEGFTGGEGLGGESYARVDQGGSLTFRSAQVAAIGVGGSGGSLEIDGTTVTFAAAGGDGFGGSTEISATGLGSNLKVELNTPTSAAFPGFFEVLQSSTGIGGNATGGSGIGGRGIGGSLLISATGGANVELPLDPAADPNSASFVRVIARGIGGGSSVEGGAGGSASGGTGVIAVDGSTLSMGATVFSIFSQGGSSLNSNLNIDGGDATGGQRVISVINGGTLTAELAGGVSGGVGGNGSGTGNGGDVIGGTATLLVDNSTLNLVGRSVVTDLSTGGNGAIGGSITNRGIVNFTAIGSTVNVLPNAAGLAEVSIGGSAFGGTGVTQGGTALGAIVNVEINESDWNGGRFTASASAIGGDATGPGGIGGDADAHPVFFVGTTSNFSLIGESSILSDAVGGAGAVGGTADAGFASLDLLETNFSIDPDTAGVSRLLISAFADGGAGDENGDAFGGTAQLLLFDSTLSADIIDLDSGADGSATVTDGIGGIANAGRTEAIIENNSSLNAFEFSLLSSAITSIGDVASGGVAALDIASPSGGVPSVEVANLTLEADATGGFTSTPLNFAGVIAARVTSGDLLVDALNGSAIGDTLGEQGTSLLLANGGSIRVIETMSIDTLDSFLIQTGNGGIIGGPDVLDPTAIISIQSQGTISILGDDDNAISFGGATLNLASRDIVIENGARVGAFTMNFQSLNEDAPAILGGGGTPAGGVTGEGYSLIGEELDRLEVGSFNFVQPNVAQSGPNDPDLILRDLLGAGSLDDGVSNVVISVAGAGGVARIEGQVVIADSDVEDTFSLFAQDRIEIITPGGLALLDPNSRPTGTVFLGSNNIWIADSDMIALLQSDPAFTGRNDQLAVAAAGSDDPLGYLRAGGVVLEVGQSLLVRNTGTDTAQGGILVGDGGLTIRGTSGTELDVFAYGARIDAAGNLIVGEAFFDEVVFDDGSSSGSTLYSDESEFNDCLINTNDCGTTVDPDPDPDPEPDPDPDPVEEEVEEQAAVVNNPSVIEAAVATTQPVPTTEQESDDDFGFDFPGLVSEPENEEETEVDDPVAAGGDASLYSQGNIGTVRVEDN